MWSKVRKKPKFAEIAQFLLVRGHRTLWDIAKKNQGYLIILPTIGKISKFITKNATVLLEF